MNWPGYNYLGPGNALNNGPPVNSIDEVARQHDYAYDRSETYSDIVNADKLAIEKFRVEYEKTGKVAAKVGQLGLQAKTSVETTLGRTLYPWNMPKGRAPSKPSTSTSDAPYGFSKRGKPLNRGQYLYSLRAAQSRQRPSALPPLQLSDTEDDTENIDPQGDFGNSHDTVDQAMDQMQSDAPATASTAAPGSSSMGSGTGIQYLSNNPPNVQRITFKRSRYMKSWGNKIKYFNEPENKDAKSPTMYTTSMAWLPVELLKFYINKAEYESLPYNAKVTAVRVKVTPVGSLCCFTTNASNASWTNSTQTLFGLHAIGLNRTGFVKANKINARTATKPMEIESVSVVTVSDWNRLFATTDDSTHLPSTFGVIRSLPWYTSVFQPSKEYFPDVGSFDLSKYVTLWEFSGHVKQPIINYEYKTVNGYIKHKRMVHNLVQASKKIHMNIQPTVVCDITGDADNVIVDKTSTVYLKSQKYNKYNETFIDDMFQGMMNETSSVNVLQPSVHFGILACQANAPDDGLNVSPEFVNVSAIWQIDSEIDIEWDINCVMQRHTDLGMYQQSVHNTGSYNVGNYYNYPSVFGSLNYTT